jgi:hypothetical protein
VKELQIGLEPMTSEAIEPENGSFPHYKSFNVKTSQSASTSRCSVTALNNGYSSAMFSLAISGNESEQLRFFNFRGHAVARWLTLHT